MLQIGRAKRDHTYRAREDVTGCIFTSNIFATSVALAEVHALLSDILIAYESQFVCLMNMLMLM